MATACEIQKSYPLPACHATQSNSSTSMAQQPHRKHGHNPYTSSLQMLPKTCEYPPCPPIHLVQPSHYTTHPSFQTQSMVVPQQTRIGQMPPHQPANTSSSGNFGSSDMKKTITSQLESSQGSDSALQESSVQSRPSAGSRTAPGPVPATTPLVLRQDSNGVRWLAFEYSRNRVKMKYTIRCDVGTVNVNNLSPEFKRRNCVYPRAFCSKDDYSGNRLVYESECNSVGWALADLNPALRCNRGLIQRAVDSWRNSSQDPRLRSRRVRRQAEVSRRQSMLAVPGSPSYMAPDRNGPLLLGIPCAVPLIQHPSPYSGPSISGLDKAPL